MEERRDNLRLLLPPEPEEPGPGECCRNDCSPCVRDVYAQALRRHQAAVRMLQAQRALAAGTAPPCSIALEILDSAPASPASSRLPIGAPVPHPPTVSTAAASSAGSFMAPIVGATVLTEAGLRGGLDVRRTVLVELQLPRHLHGAYAPGDYAVVRPHNPLDTVLSLLRRLRVNGDQVIRVVSSTDDQDEEADGREEDNSMASQCHHHLIGRPSCSIQDVLLYKCDITSPPSKAMLHSLAQFTYDEEEKEELLYLCGQEKWQREFYLRNILAQRPSLLELLERYPSCVPPLEYVLEHLPPQQERYYSIASSPLLYPSSIHVLFPVVEYTTPAPQRRKRQGLCTSWLHSLANAHHHGSDRLTRCDSEEKETRLIDGTIATGIVMCMKQANDFKLPDDPAVPLILVCAGSGIAPFRGFLQHRKGLHQHLRATFGECWLFFGFRFLSGDFLFRDELEEMLREGVLTRLITATSREVEARRVQDRLIEHGQDIYRLLAQRAVLYVCGDAQGMAAGVHDALVQIIQTYDHTGEDAQAVLSRLRCERRYLRDVWSTRKFVS